MHEPLGHPPPPSGGGPRPWRPRPVATGERVVTLGIRACGAVPVLLSAGLLVILGQGAWSAAEGLAMPPGGLWPRVLGTLLVAGLAGLLAIPVGILAAMFLSEFARPGLRRWLKPALELLAGIPTVVYALVAVLVVGPALQQVVPGLQVPSALLAALVLALMIVPTVSSLSEDALRAVPRELREAALALGASRLRMLRVVVVPTAAPGIAAAVMLAVSRAVGETMIMTLAAGHVPRTGLDPRLAVETLTGYVGAVGLGRDVHASMFTAGAAVLGLSLLAHAVTLRLARRRGRWT